MTPAVVLLVYALLLAGAAALLREAAWVERAPRLGIAAWQALTGGVLLAVLLAGLAPVIPHIHWGGGLAAFLHACAAALAARYATPGGALGVALGALLAVAVALRGAYGLLVGVVVAGRQRRRQRDMLALIGRRDPVHDVFVIDHGCAAVYCLPGRGRHVVLTSAALQALGEGQLRAVLAHERAHLRERHHLVVAAARAAERAFPWVGLFGHARAEIERLVEMAADDVASRDSRRQTVASALVALADGSVPAAALAAGGSTAVARVRRLLAPQRSLGASRTVLGFTAAALLVAAPFVIAGGPAIAVAHLTATCPFDPASCLL